VVRRRNLTCLLVPLPAALISGKALCVIDVTKHMTSTSAAAPGFGFDRLRPGTVATSAIQACHQGPDVVKLRVAQAEREAGAAAARHGAAA